MNLLIINNFLSKSAFLQKTHSIKRTIISWFTFDTTPTIKYDYYQL